MKIKYLIILLVALLIICNGCSSEEYYTRIKEKINNLDTYKLKELENKIVLEDIKDGIKYNIDFELVEDRVDSYLINADFNSKEEAKAFYEKIKSDKNYDNIKIKNNRVSFNNNNLEKYKDVSKEDLIKALER